ncbi:hypothetical protein C5Y96_01375 [Blastopirellula marina]|uniref:Peptidase M48 domain-containing protein n=1 Tax=Blastopirellula marina TaxID=124 RepID=A0A2S8G721_9BACT|nr:MULTISPECIES: M48 family metalloprotease [Pirellulaceae]PQO40252.1 hypothetical protein C5Y96_01375 [Blastopirellula marina]RCS55800.1 hypothetical protein DTL36_01375 [Bremerella cremea]
METAASPSDSSNVQQLLDSLERELPPVQWSPLYRVSVWFSAACLILLTLIYFAIILVVGWVAFDYFLSHLRLLGSGVSVWVVLLYSLPPLFLLALLALVIKPFFRISPSREEPVVVTRKDEPLLFEFVQRICNSVGTRMIDEVHFTVGAEAAVYNSGPMGGLFPEKRILILGLPLIASCDIASLAGIIAHEMGHFALEKNIKLRTIIGIVNGMFYRAMYEPDKFDIWLAINTQEGQSLRLLLLPIKKALSLGRWILWVFFVTAEASSCLISRKDEFDCDQYMARLVGSDIACRSLQRVHLLGMAASATNDDLTNSWQEKRLPDDLPRFILSRVGRWNARQQEISLKLISSNATRWFDTHPSLPARINALQKLELPTMPISQDPAGHLLRDFDRRCTEMTVRHYKEVLESDFDPSSLVSTEVLNAEYTAEEKAQKALRRYMQAESIIVKPIFPDPDADMPVDNYKQAAESLAIARQNCIEQKDKLSKANEEFLQTRGEFQNVKSFQKLIDLKFIENADVSFHYNRAQRHHNRAQEMLSTLYPTVRRRMTLALRILHTSQLWRSDKQSVITNQRKRVDRVMALCKPLAGVQPLLDELSSDTLVLDAILSRFDVDRLSFQLKLSVTRLGEKVHRGLKEIQYAFGEVKYPFEHRDGVVKVSDFLVPKLPDKGEFVELTAASMETLQRTDRVVSRTLATLTEACEKVEAALGHKIQPNPKELDPWEQLNDDLDEMTRKRFRRNVTTGAIAALVVVGLTVGFFYAITYSPQPGKSIIPHHPEYRATVVPERWAVPEQSLPRMRQPNIPSEFRPEIRPPSFAPPSITPPDPHMRVRPPSMQPPSFIPPSRNPRSNPAGFPDSPSSRMPSPRPPMPGFPGPSGGAFPGR